MKVITIGRGHDNDVSINDPYVGRHHCQIVQYDDGSFTIVDMNSTNGTYVNGRRVFGEIRLQPNDTITIGHINLPWMSYFTSVMPPSSSSQSSMALPITLGITGGVLLLTFVFILCFGFFRSGSDKAFAFKRECPDAVVVSMMDEEGIPYTIEALEGQVCVWFENGVSYEIAKKSIKKSGGIIVAQIPDNGYYLVKVPTEKVQVFLKKITKESFVDWAYPNMISYSCGVYNYVLDNYYRDTRREGDTARHGYIVEHALQEYGSNIAFRHFNIGNENGFSMCASNELGNGCANSEFFALDTISRLNNDGPIFINMSYGPSLPKRIINGTPQSYYWDSATNSEQTHYQYRYVNALKKTIMNLKPLEGKDYVVVVAAGNEGVKSYYNDIITYLRENLSPKEKDIMDKHFLLVTAGETEEIHKDYSNEMEAGHFDPWVTKVDVSDFKYPKNGKKWRGTSFAAPRAVGILSSIAKEKNLTGAEVLKYARETTLNSIDHHTLTYESLMNTVKSHQSTSSKHDTPKQPIPKETNPSAPSSQDLLASLAGTKWEMPRLAKQPRKQLHRVEFVNDHQVKIISMEDSGIDNPYNTNLHMIVIIIRKLIGLSLSVGLILRYGMILSNLNTRMVYCMDGLTMKNLHIRKLNQQSLSHRINRLAVWDGMITALLFLIPKIYLKTNLKDA